MKKLFEGQFQHVVWLIALLTLCNFIVKFEPSILNGALFSLSSKTWLYIGICVPILHQIYVWFCWRTELHFRMLTNLLGEKAFRIYKIDFSLLIISRPISVLLLSISNMNSLSIPFWLVITLSCLLIIPPLYLAYSIRHYFTIDRAFGIDHFKPDEAKKWPLVRKGIFAITPNAMYLFGFLMLYVIALLFSSKAGLLLAVFNHAYIWVHYFFTEKPDMKFIYNE